MGTLDEVLVYEDDAEQLREELEQRAAALAAELTEEMHRREEAERSREEAEHGRENEQRRREEAERRLTEALAELARPEQRNQ